MKDIITKHGILNTLNTEFEVEVLESVGSTNALLKQRAKNGLSAPYLLVASHQTKGRGRMGRSFFSPDNSGIYLSLLLKPNLSPDKLTLITSAAAVAVCNAIYKLTGKKAKIKWVNDIFIDGKKVCGILTESIFPSQNNEDILSVLGIGLNVYPPQNGFPDEIKNSAGYITEKYCAGFKDNLIATIINNFFEIWQTDFIDKYKELCFVQGENIQVISPSAIKNAFAVDIDDMCRLLVKYDDGTAEWLSSGEISIKI